MSERDIFLAALDRESPTDRTTYLDEACAGDPALRRQVEALLLSHEGAGSFLGTPVAEQAATNDDQADAPTIFVPPAKPESQNPNGEPTDAGRGGSDEPLTFLTPTDQPGRLGRLGHYQIMSIIGQGGMGVVLKAFDESLHRVVAIKVMAPQLATTASARQRFIREARAAAAVAHEHVVTIHAVDETSPLPHIVMQCVEGTSLEEKLNRVGHLGVKEILRIGTQAAAGLAAAHKQGLIHRDIKPANILLENGVERVKITDFGLARAADDASMTQSGLIAGTPQYMSPEQAEGRQVDQRSDLFSLGSVLYALCTGRPAFRANSTVAVLKRVCEEAPRPIREINPEIPEWLCDIIAKLHAKDPADRFQSAKEVAELLEQHLSHVQQPDVVPRPAKVKLPPVSSPTLGSMEKLLEETDFRQRIVQHYTFLSGVALVWLSLMLFASPRVLLLVSFVTFASGAAALAVAVFTRQRFAVTYRGHDIRVVNGILAGEKLYIDGKVAARGGLGRRKEIRAALPNPKLAGDEIVVLCEAGLMRFRCRIFVEHGCSPAAYPALRNIDGYVAIALGAALLLAAFSVPIVGIGWNRGRIAAFFFEKVPLANGSAAQGVDKPSSNSAVVEQMERAVAAKQAALELVRKRHAAGVSSAGELLTAEIDLIETQVRLSQAAQNKATTVKLLRELVAKRTVERSRVKTLISAGSLPEGAIHEMDAKLAEAQAQLAEAVGGFAAEGLWTPIFNGKDFDGWVAQTRVEGQDPKAPWRIADGVLWAHGGNGGRGTLRTDKQYENYSLKMKFRFPRRAPGDQQYMGETGVVVHRQEAEAIFPNTCIGLNLGRAWEGRSLHVSIYPEKSAKKADAEPVQLKPAGEWNDLLVFCQADSVEAWVNGKLAAKLTECTNSKGYIALNANGTPMDFRDIQVKELRSGGVTSPALAFAPFDAKKAKEHQGAWSAHLGIKLETTNSLGMDLRLIPPGSFLMGSSAKEMDWLLANVPEFKEGPEWLRAQVRSEGPDRRVTIREPFRIANHEVTVGQFREFVKATNYQTEAEKNGGGFVWNDDSKKFEQEPANIWSNPTYSKSESHPLVFVTLADARAFCAWLSEKEGNRYDVPTEEQWEFACRAGSGDRWYFGDDETAMKSHGWTVPHSSGMNQPVGRLAANPFGLFDVYGNATELTTTPQQTVVERGGQAGESAQRARSAWRVPVEKVNETHARRGLRVVCKVEPASEPSNVATPPIPAVQK